MTRLIHGRFSTRPKVVLGVGNPMTSVERMGVTEMSDDDFAMLVGWLVRVAQELLEKQRGEFSPFGAMIDKNGELGHLAADTGEKHTEATNALRLLSTALRARMKQNEIRAFGICVNVGARLPGYADEVDAICCQLEHASARPVQIFVPFHKNQLGHLEYDKPVALPGQPSEA
jgi:hypothetical protein